MRDKIEVKVVTINLGTIVISCQVNPYYRNTIEFPDRRICFDSVAPERFDIRETPENITLSISEAPHPIFKIKSKSFSYVGELHKSPMTYEWYPKDLL